MSSGTRSQQSVFQEMLDEAMRRIDTVEASQRQTAQENVLLRQQLEAAQGLLMQQRNQTPRPDANYKEPKVSAPETFHGRNRSKLSHFLLGVNIVLSTQPSRFPNEAAKINYAISYLRDDAKAWVEPFASKPVEQQPAFMTNFELFVKELKTIFGDPDEVATAERQIRLLRQKGPASTYFADFRRYAAVLDWNDSALTSQAYVGLKDLIKDEFARTGRPETLDELILAATRIDNRLHERQVERERSSTSTAAGRILSSPTSSEKPIQVRTTTTVVKHEPNTTASNKRPSLAPEEKERRRREGLCLYCGSADHLLAACPMAKPIGARPGASNRGQATSSPQQEN